MTIEDEHYGETRRALMADPIIRDMAEGVRHMATWDLAHADGAPRFEFMNGALREYKRRGGTIPTHIGGPAEAILALLAGADDTEETP
jgi:hypothetical protein